MATCQVGDSIKASEIEWKNKGEKKKNKNKIKYSGQGHGNKQGFCVTHSAIFGRNREHDWKGRLASSYSRLR